MEYRPEIDGLRAVAVLSVILYHAGFRQVAGGYVGVDVFFVISGYLITSIIVRDIEAGTFSIGSFYRRRARRIFPALFVVTVVSMIAAWWTLSPGEIDEFGRSVAAVATFTSNIFFENQSDYFDSAAELRPLLHTWSLAVEEQYYLVFPLLLLGLSKVGRRGVMIATIAIITVVSLALGDWASIEAPTWAFYSLATRAWELLIGALCAFVPRVWMQSSSLGTRMARSAMSVVGLGAIAYAVLIFDERTPTPSLITLVPTVGVALVILFSDAKDPVGRLLSLRPVVFIGLISYSAYLWHQPVFVFARQATAGQEAREQAIALILLSLALAVPTWRFVEQPFRTHGEDRRTLPIAFGSLVLLAAAGLAMIAGYNTLRSDSIALPVHLVDFEQQRRFEPREDICAEKGWPSCDIPTGDAYSVLVIGDSQANDLYNTFDAVLGQRVDLAISTIPGCPMHPDITELVPAQHPNLRECIAINEQRYDAAYLNQFDALGLNVLLSWYDEEDLGNYVDWLAQNYTGQVVVLGSAFQFDRPLPEVFNEQGNLDGVEDQLTRDPREFEVELSARVEALDYLFLSQADAFCGTGGCEFVLGVDELVSYDQHHLSLYAVDRLAEHHGDLIEAYLR